MNRRGGVRERVGRSAVEALEHRVLLSSAIAAFAGQQTFGTGGDPRSVGMADVNRDGKPDLVVASHDGSSVSVLLGNGDGTFGAQRTFAAGAQPYSVAVADVNGDGKADALVADFAGACVSVLLGNGDGSFQAPLSFSAGVGAYSVVTGDFNGDGKIDAAVSDYGAGAVSILLGNGNGTFSAPAAQPVGATPSGLAVGDFNGDGKADLVSTDYTVGTVSVLLGNGNGTFLPHADVAAGSVPNSVTVGDLNSDGRIDIAVANFATAGQVNLLLGNGNGTFQARRSLGTASQPAAIAIADINRDGKMDLAVASFGVSNAVVLLGDGSGNFQPGKLFGVSTQPASIAVGDVNSDGRPDLVVGDAGASAVSVLVGDVPPRVLSINRTSPAGPNVMAASVTYTVTFNVPVTGVDASDFVVDASGPVVTKPLAVSGGPSVYTVSITGISGWGTLGLNLVDDGSIKDAAGNPLQPGGAAAFGLQTLQFSQNPRSLDVGDVERDGKLDLVVGNYQAGASEFSAFATPHTIFSLAASISFVQLADLNGDGKPDLVDVMDVPSGTVDVSLGNGDGTFQARRTFAAGVYSRASAIGDFNGDGRPDVVVTNAGSFSSPGNTLSLFLGNGDGTLQAAQTLGTSGQPFVVTTADVNRDGRVDLIVGNDIANNAGVFLGNGNGTFKPEVEFPTGGSPSSVSAADINGDGRVDIVVGNYYGSTASVLLGNGDGTFQPQRTFATGKGAEAGLVVDVNGDGRLDMVFATRIGGAAEVLLGNGDGTFAPRQTFVIGVDPSSIVAADYNADGLPDLAVATSGSNNISLLTAGTSAGFVGQVYTLTQPSDTVSGTGGIDTITLTRDSDPTLIDWSMGASNGKLPVDDPNGLTVNGNGGADVISLNYAAGNPLPNKLHLNGTFTVNGLGGGGANALAATTIEIGQSTVFFNYASVPDPVAMIRQALQNGYNGGAWNGSATGSAGVITSAAAALSPNTYSVGYADSADGTGVNTTANTVKVRFTLNGDANLNGTVDIFDLNMLLPHYNSTGAWTSGDFTYNGAVDIFDLNALLPNYNHSTGAASSAPTQQPAATATGQSAMGAVSASALFAADSSSALDIIRVHTARRPKKSKP